MLLKVRANPVRKYAHCMQGLNHRTAMGTFDKLSSAGTGFLDIYIYREHRNLTYYNAEPQKVECLTDEYEREAMKHYTDR